MSFASQYFVSRGVPLLLAALCIGCNALPAGRLQDVGTLSTNAPIAQIYLLRGWRGLWSEGIDQLADALNANRIRAKVFREDQWRELAERIVAARSDRTTSGPLIIVGFSYGADNAIALSRELAAHQITVDLLITIDPVTPPPLSDNVKQCVNFYQSNGVMDIFPWLRGIPLQSDGPPGQLLNQNLRADRMDLLEADTSHATIAGNRKLHREIVRRIVGCIVLTKPG